jgi:hypothetical protein
MDDERDDECFSSKDLPDVGADVWAGANDFDYPLMPPAQNPPQGKNTSSMVDAFFEQPRRHG